MPLPRASLSSFLTSAKYLLSNPSKPFTIIIGNESADLDSLCSALLLAYLRTYSPVSKTFYIPLSAIPRADLSLRPELVPVLKRANLKPNDLLTLSDLPRERIEAKWVLVDHNKLQGELGREYWNDVVGCVDHHDEENAVPRETGEEPRVVEKCGSCASLVVRYCRGAWGELSKVDSAGDKELAGLAMGPILIDTRNLGDENKTMEVDREAVRHLEGKGASGREEYLGEIEKAKSDIGGMDFGDILRKDYKQWSETRDFKLGVSSVVKDMEFLIEKAGDDQKFFQTLKKFSEERELDICSIMTTSNSKGVFRRELLVWAFNEKGVKAGKKFEQDSREKLGLKHWKDGSLDVDYQKQWRKCWWQERVENSRKQVAPLLRSAIDS